MRKHISITIAICCALIGACVQAPTTETTSSRVSLDYEATGDAKGIHPFIYGKHTLIEFKSAPFWLTVKDRNGVTVDYKKEGRYYSLDRVLDYFTISTGGRKVVFNLAPLEQQPAAAKATLDPLVDSQAPVSTGNDPTSSPVQLQVQEKQPPLLDEFVLKLMQIQLTHYRRLLQKAESDDQVTGDELQALNKKLEAMGKMMDTGIAIIHIQFDHLSTTLHLKDGIQNVLLPAAKAAQRINIYGRTSSIVAGKKDPAIALKRARNTQDFLVKHGVAAEKIQISSLAAGDFIAPTNTKEGKAANRRVAIEMIYTQQ